MQFEQLVYSAYQFDLRNQIRSDQLVGRVQLFETPWITACQASLSITNSQSSLRLTSIESVMPSSHLILCRPLLSSSNCCFLTCIQISQEAGHVVWYSHLFQNFPQFIVIHTVKGFGIINKAEIDVFLELSCFFHDPADVGNLISGSSAFFKTRLNIWKFTVHILLGEFWALLYYCVRISAIVQ